MYILKFNTNWGDEFDIHGYSIFTSTQKEKWEDFVEKNKNKYIQWSFGTNESFEDETLEDFASRFEISEISKEEANVISSVIGKTWGNFPNIFEILVFEFEEEDEYESFEIEND